MTALPIIACVGAGRMGRGMAHAFAYAGHNVRLVDAKERSAAEFQMLAAQALDEISASLTLQADIGACPRDAVAAIMTRISIAPRADAGTALGAVPFIFEGVPETVTAKQEAFAFIDNHASPDAIVASTTSTFLSTGLAQMTNRPAQFLNAHWLNPAFLIPLVEVSPHEQTNPAITEAMVGLLESIGKVPVLCKASPGYIVPRIQMLAMNEAARLVEEGVATAADIDKAVRYGFGLRFAVLGLLEFIDWGGGDILYYASKYMTGAIGEPRFGAPGVIERNMAENRIGMRTGAGFYDWQSIDVPAFRREKLAALVRMLRDMDALRPPVV